MPGFFRKRKLVVFFTSIILIVAIIGYSIRNDEQSNIFSQFIADTVGFFQNIASKPVHLIIDFAENIKDYRHIYEQNKILKQELQNYKTLVYKVSELEKENEELRSLVDLEVSISDYKPIRGTVIARSPERLFDQVTINKGRLHGVRPNMAVITAEGMIGKIIGASQLTSKVQLLSGFDENNRISVVVAEDENVFGLIEGFDSETQSLIFRELTNSGSLEEGQTIISSGMGGVFPRGLLIGTIKSIEMDQYGLTNIAYVEPAADLLDINHVIVIDREIFSPIIDEEEEE